MEDLEDLITNMQLAVKQKREYERKLLERAKRTREMLRMAREFALRRILSRRIRRACRPSFDKMGGNVKAMNAAGGAAMKQRRMDSVMDRAKRRMLNRSLSAGFAGWCDCVNKSTAKKRLLFNAVRRMKHGKLVHIWESWYKLIEMKNQKAHKVRMLISIIKNSRMLAPFRHWASNAKNAAAAAAKAAADENRVQVIMRRAMNKLKWKTVHACFESWASVLDDKDRRAKVLQTVLKKLKFGRESAAFEGWVDFTLERQHKRKALSRILKQMIHGVIVPAFSKLEDNWRHGDSNDKMSRLEAQGAPELAELRRRIEELRNTIKLHDLQLDTMRDQVEAAEFKTRDAENKLKRSDYAGWQRRIKKQETLAKATIALQEQTCLELARAHDELAKLRGAGGASAGMAAEEREALQFRADRAESECRRLRRITRGMQEQMGRYRNAAQKMVRDRNAPLAIKGQHFDGPGTSAEFGFPEFPVVVDPMAKSMPMRTASRQSAFNRSIGGAKAAAGSSNSQRLWMRKSAVPPTAQESMYARASGRTEALALASQLRSGEQQDGAIAHHRALAMQMSKRQPNLSGMGSRMVGTMAGLGGSRSAAFPSHVRSASGIVDPDAKPWKAPPPEIYAVLKQLSEAVGEGVQGPESGTTGESRMLYGTKLESLEGAFRAADKDRSGVLSREEIRDALRRLDIAINPSQLRYLIECVGSSIACFLLRLLVSALCARRSPTRILSFSFLSLSLSGTSTSTTLESWTTVNLSQGSGPRWRQDRARKVRIRGCARRAARARPQ